MNIIPFRKGKISVFNKARKSLAEIAKELVQQMIEKIRPKPHLEMMQQENPFVREWNARQTELDRLQVELTKPYSEHSSQEPQNPFS